MMIMLVLVVGCLTWQVVIANNHHHPTLPATPPSVLNYTSIACTGVQDDCCSDNTPIGFNFPFYCNTYKNFTASDNGYLSLLGADCNLTRWPAILALSGDIQLQDRGEIAAYAESVGGVDVRVVEWSDVVFYKNPNHGHDRGDSHFGAFQVWLFQNGSIGLVYHLTGGDFGKSSLIALKNNNATAIPSNLQVLSSESETFLRAYDAYMLFPGANCDMPYTVVQWLTAPDICFNTDRVKSHGRDHRQDSRFTYPPLSLCNGNFSSSDKGNGNNSNGVKKKKASAIGGSLIAGVLAPLLILVLVVSG